MIVTIIFAVASIALLIFTTIYVKKKNRQYSLRAQEKIRLRRKKKNIKTIWGIDDIRDGILTINGKNSIIIELGSIEYRLLNDDEQNNIDNSLARLSKTFTNQTQFLSTIERIDTTDKIEAIRKNIEKQRNSNIKVYGENIIEYLEEIMKEEDLYVRKNYLIMTSKETFEKAERELKEYYHELEYGLSNIKVTTKLLMDMEIIELLYRELNKNSNEKLRNIIKEGGLDFYVQSRAKT